MVSVPDLVLLPSQDLCSWKCGVRRTSVVRVGCVACLVFGPSSWLSRGFSSVRRPRSRRSPFPIRCLLDCLSLARPSRTPCGFPYCGSLLRRWVGSTAGAAISNFSSPLPTLGVHPQSVSQSVVSLSLSFRLSLSSNPTSLPRRVLSSLPEP